jgi:2-dehydropantoate 2-reductase
MRHAILGAGGVGGLVGGALARAGHPVSPLVQPGRAEQYPERLSVRSRALGSFETPVRVAERLGEPSDVVWIAVKAIELEAALDAVPPEELGDRVVAPLLKDAPPATPSKEHAGWRRTLCF